MEQKRNKAQTETTKDGQTQSGKRTKDQKSRDIGKMHKKTAVMWAD